MSSRELREYTQAVPFVPFRIVMTDGKEFSVKGPEWLIIGSSTSTLGVPGPDGFADEMIRIAHWHIQRIISPEPATSNS